tara:strand:+ start:1649 stop:2617 length:969 start_codon:yes stop_codon:yes gene_type:complete
MAYKWLNLSSTKNPQWKTHKPLDSWLKKPLLLIGGWWDPHLRGILDIFEKSIKAGGNPKLIVGPATHLKWWEGSQRTQLKFFDSHLKEKSKKTLFNQSSLWNLTTNNWEVSVNSKSPSWTLRSEGLACISHIEGGLVVLNSDSKVNCEVNLVHDPWRPVPSIGGHLSDSPGEVNRFDLDTRSDVAVFTTQPMSKDLRIEGIPNLYLETKCDMECFDLFVALSIIPSEIKNTATQLSTGVLRIDNFDKDRKAGRNIRLQPLLATFNQGDRLRISISGSGWPAIGINPGQNQYLCESAGPHCKVTTISLLLSNSKLKFESLISS